MNRPFSSGSILSSFQGVIAESLVCPSCESTDLTTFFEIPELPVNVGNFYDTPEAARMAPTASISLQYCSDCGLVHNRAFERNSEIFQPGYEVSLRHSKTFRKFIKSVAERLVTDFDLRGRKITEIGCGDAYFLENLATLGCNECIGIDPTIVMEGSTPTDSGSVKLIRDYFSEDHTHHETDFICCLSVFEDIPRIAEFLKNVHTLASRNNAPVYFEVFNGWRAFEQCEVWSVHYEQCNYFSLRSLENVFLQNGFKIKNSGECYSENQYLFVEAIAVEQSTISTLQMDHSPSMPITLSNFSRHFSDRRNLWEKRFRNYRNENQTVVLWGTGGKGITFLNTVPGADLIEVVAEINPDKHLKYLPVTGQKVVPVETLVNINPDKIIITNPIYKEEMMEQAADLGLSAEFLVA
ncbi:MAG: methyltransferase domain-containing protein [Pseudomonadota bacterium]